MSNILVDTSVLIDHLRGTSDDFKRLEQVRISEKIELHIPHIVIIELFAGQEARNKKAKTAIEALLNGLVVVGLTINSAKKAGEFIRTYRQVPDPFDCIIAAISLEYNATIATHNQKHFKQIPHLKLFNFSLLNNRTNRNSN